MRNDLIKISKAGMSHEEWLAHRLSGVGGSEVSTIMGLNPYMSNVELFYMKLGEVPNKQENLAMFMGNYMEDKVAELWEYYDPATGDYNSIIENYNKENKIRRCRRLNSILINPDYPWLFANVDRLINKADNSEEKLLEIKTISGFVVNQWQAGIPPYHIVQLITYLLITGLKQGELAMLKDGRNFEILPFDFNEKIANGIITDTKEFWDRVLEARKLRETNPVAPVEHLEPDPVKNEAYLKFLTERHKMKIKEIDGTPKLLMAAGLYTACTNYTNKIKVKQIECKSTLMEELVKTEAGTINFKTAGKVSYLPDKNGKKTFSCRISDKDVIQEQIEILIQEMERGDETETA